MTPALSHTQALALTQGLMLLALLLQNFENFQLRRHLSEPDSPWSWSVLEKDWDWLGRFAVLPLGGLLALQLAAIGSGFALLAMGAALTPLLWGPLFILTLFVSMRFRGAPFGGSDTMSLVLLMALMFAACLPHEPWATYIALQYIAIQSLLSYFVSGVFKATNGTWRSGRALTRLIQQHDYDVPQRLQVYNAKFPRWSRLLCWLILLFEIAIGFVGLMPQTLIFWLGAGALFHLANFVVLGLNRFVFVWIATYPAIYWLLSKP